MAKNPYFVPQYVQIKPSSMTRKAPTPERNAAGPGKSSVRPHGLAAVQKRRSKVFTFNPAYEDIQREEPEHTQLSLFKYNKSEITYRSYGQVQDLLSAVSPEKNSWIHVTGLRTGEVSQICEHFGIHQLTVEDILSVGQRAKMDELGNGIFCLLPVLSYNAAHDEIEMQQVSLILTHKAVLSFFNLSEKDLFNRVRSKLELENSRLRGKNADFLFYYLLDSIVDDYFTAIEILGIQIEEMEERIIRIPNSRTLLRLNNFRQKTGALRRAIAPVRDLINGILKSDNPFIDSRTRQYIKDVYDHIVQANETTDSYRDLIMNLQSLYINQVGLKMNEIMKVLAIVTALFAPLTLIAGIYGMNFDNMPELHTRYGYFITLGVMGLLFLLMLYVFKKRKWF